MSLQWWKHGRDPLWRCVIPPLLEFSLVSPGLWVFLSPALSFLCVTLGWESAADLKDLPCLYLESNSLELSTASAVTWALNTSWLVTFMVIRSQTLILWDRMTIKPEHKLGCLFIKTVCIRLLVGIKGVTSMCSYPQSHGSSVECFKAPHGYQEFLSSESLFDYCQDPTGEHLWVVYREQRQWNQMNRTRLHEGKTKHSNWFWGKRWLHFQSLVLPLV